MKSKQLLGGATNPDDCFSIDRPNQLLWHGNSYTKLPPKVFQLLIYFRDNPRRILDYSELLDAVWQHESVQPEILKTYIKNLRRLLHDDALAPKFIETRTRAGYCFIGVLPDHCDKSIAPSNHLVGRDKASSALKTARAALDGPQKKVIFITGETGIGKTSLINDFLNSTSNNSDSVWRIDCAPAKHVLFGFSPVRELIRIVSTTPFVNTTAGDCMTEAEYLFRAIESQALLRPVVLVIENLQWADAATIETVSRLAFASSPAKLMILASSSASMTNDVRCLARTLMLDLLVHGLASELRLEALTSADVKSLVLFNSSVALPRGALEAIEMYGAGNPLIISALVERMIIQVRESGHSDLIGVLSRYENEFELFQRTVPDVIRHSLELQLLSYGERASSILQCGSNSGTSFCAWGVSQVLGLQQLEVEEICKKICGNDQLLRESSLYVFPDGSVTPIYTFRHNIYARLILASQSHSQRDFVHQRFVLAVETFWGDRVDSVAVEMVERFAAVYEWTRALHYAKLALTSAARKSRSDTESLLRKGLELSAHLPEKQKAIENDFFMKKLSQLT
jgi:hypothetical protein